METLRATGYAGSFGLLLLGAFMNDHIDMKVISAGVVLEAAFLGNILDATSGHYLERTGFLTKAKKIHRNTNKKVQRLNERFDRANLPTKA